MLKLYNVGIFLSGKGISWDESGDRKLDKERNREEETSETSHNVDAVIKGKNAVHGASKQRIGKRPQRPYTV